MASFSEIYKMLQKRQDDIDALAAEPSLMDEWIEKNDPEQWEKIENARIEKSVPSLVMSTIGCSKLPGLKGTGAMPEILPATEETLTRAKIPKWQEEGITLEKQLDIPTLDINHPRQSHEIIARDKRGNIVGSSNYYNYRDKPLMSPDIIIEPEARRKGLATAMHEMAERDTGRKILRGEQTLDSQSLWSQPDRKFGIDEQNLTDETIDALNRAVANKKFGIEINPDKPLPMDEASRMGRARIMNFNPEQTWYHGTKADIKSFVPDYLGSSTKAPSARKAYFFASNQEAASHYAENAIKREYFDVKNRERELSKQIFDLQYKGPFIKEDWMDGYINVNDSSRFPRIYKEHELPKDVLEEIKERYKLIDSLESELQKASIESEKQAGSLHKEIYEKLESNPEYYSLKDKILSESNPEKKQILEDELDKLTRKIISPITQRNATIYPVHLQMENPFIYDFKGLKTRPVSYSDLVDRAMQEGHDSAIFKNTFDGLRNSPMDVGVIFDPNQIRSKFARFDPSKLFSGDILAGLAAAGLSFDQIKQLLNKKSTDKDEL